MPDPRACSLRDEAEAPVIRIELDERDESFLLTYLSALETCLLANDIPSVRIELDDKQYILGPAQ